MNEVNETAPVSTPVSVVTDPHTLSHVYEQSIPAEHNWILALTVDIQSCSHVSACNMRAMVDSGAAIHVCSNWYGFSPLSLSTKQLSLKSAGGDVLHHLGSKTESFVYRSLKFQVNYEVAPVARPILSVDMLTREGVLVVAPIVQIAIPGSNEASGEGMGDSRNVSECEAPQIPVLEGAREVNRSKQPTESERRRHELNHLPHVPWCTICCRARTIDDAHHVVIHEESVDSLPKMVCDYAEINMKGDTTPMRGLLVVVSSAGYLGATDVDQKRWQFWFLLQNG